MRSCDHGRAPGLAHAATQHSTVPVHRASFSPGSSAYIIFPCSDRRVISHRLPSERNAVATIAPWYRIAVDALYTFARDDGWAIASHIALSTLMSLFPFLIFVTALTGFFRHRGARRPGGEHPVGGWPKEVAGPLAGQIANVLTTARSGLLTYGVVLAIYFSSSGIESLRIGLNRAYNVIELRPWWLLRLESIAYVLVGALGWSRCRSSSCSHRSIFRTALRYAPWWSGSKACSPLPGSDRDRGPGGALVMAHKWLPFGQRRLIDIAPGSSSPCRLGHPRRRLRPLPRRFAGDYVSPMRVSPRR